MKLIEKNKKLYLYIFFFLIFFFVSLLLVHKEFQNDTFYTIKVGEAISKYGVDMKDHFSFVHGLSYTYPHWLYDFLIYKLYAFAGFKGLFLSCIVLTFTLLSTMFLTCKKVVEDDGVAFLITALSSTFLSSFIAVRAQLVSYIFLLLILFSIEMVRKTGKKRYIALSFILSILIVNMHAAIYYFIFILFMPYLVSDLFYVLKNKFFPNTSLLDNKDSIIQIDEPSNDMKLLIMMLLTGLAGFICPNFPNAFTHLPLLLMGVSTQYISEHAAPSVKTNIFVYFYTFIFILILLVPKVKIKLHDLFMILGLFIMSFLSIRSFSFLVIMSIYAFGRIAYSISYTRLKHIKLVDVFRVKALYITLLVLAFSFSSVLFYLETQKDYVNKKIYPVEMVNYIKENNLDKNMRLLNGYDYGSYILFNDIEVFIDSRSDLYLPEFNKNTTQFIDCMTILHNYKQVLKKYDFTHILVNKDSTFTNILNELGTYKVIKEDSEFVLYEKV